MRLLFNYLRPRKFTAIAAIILLMIQAGVCVVIPRITGDMITTGLQNKGFSDTYPRVMSKTVYELFEKFLPACEKERFCGLYTESDDPEAVVPEGYEANASCKYLRKDADETAAEEIYENIIIAVLFAASDRNGNLDGDYRELLDNVSFQSISLYSETLDISEEEIAAYYAKTSAAAKPLKLQAAGILLPYIYDDAGIDCESVQEQSLKNSMILLIVCSVIELLCAICSSAMISGISAGIEKDIRTGVLKKSFALSRSGYERSCDADPGTVIESGSVQIGMAVNFSFNAVFYSLTTAILGCISAFTLNFYFGIFIPAAALIILAIVFIIYKIACPGYYRMQDNYVKYSSEVKKNLKNLILIRCADLLFRGRDDVAEYSSDVKKDESFTMKAVLTALTVSGFVINILMAVILLTGFSDLLSSNISLGTVIVFVQYSVIIISALMTLGTVVIFSPRAFAALKDIEKILKAEVKTFDDADFAMNGSVLTLKADELRLFENSEAVSFELEKGQFVVISGKSGSGKTAFANTVLGRFTPYSGKVLINDTDVGLLTFSYIDKIAAYEPPEPMLLTGSVKNNMLIRGAPDDDDCLLKALKDAQCDFLPDGLNGLCVPLINAGENYSGGQRSRLSVASTLAKQVQIYIFDDCLTSLDRKVREAVLEKLNHLKKDSIVILISHDKEDFAHADRVIELKREVGR